MDETVRTFTALAEEFVELFMKHHPIAATMAGIHDYDHVMPDDSPEGLRERAAWLRDIEQRLAAAVPLGELPGELRVDHALLRSRIAALRADIEEIRMHQKHPGLFLARSFLGVQLLLSRSFAPLEERKEAVVERLMAIPAYLESAQANLGAVAPFLMAQSLKVAADGPGLVDDVLRTLMRQFPGEAERLEHAASRARTGFLRFQEYLEKEVRPREGGAFAIGERWMNFKLEREHLVSLTATQVERVARDAVEHTRLMLEEEARRIDPSRTWREQLVAARLRHPESNWLRETYHDEVERARRFVVEHRLVPIPDGERLDVVDTPPFERPTTPVLSYRGPAQFDAERTGALHVTALDLRRSKEDQAMLLAEHCLPLLPVTVVRETWPGRHLQALYAQGAATRLRKLANNALLGDGWTLYALDLMHEQGYFTDPLTRLFQLRELLSHCCRAVVDVSLHTRRMSTEQAVQYLVDEDMRSTPAATGEVLRTAVAPTRGVAALLGRQQILDLRDEARQRQGSRFSLHEFHGALLGSGMIPPALAREDQRERPGVA